MSEEEDELIAAVQQEDVTYLQEKLKQRYFDANPESLYLLAWIAAENNYVESERILKKQVLEQFHKNKLSPLSFMIVNGDPLPNLISYTQEELLQALDIARFTKQPLEIRNSLKLQLKETNYAGNLQFDKKEAKRVHERYLGSTSPKSMQWNNFVMDSLMVLLVVAALATGLALAVTGAGLFALIPLAVCIIPFGGIQFYKEAYNNGFRIYKPNSKCADNLLNFAPENNNEDIFKPASVASKNDNTSDKLNSISHDKVTKDDLPQDPLINSVDINNQGFNISEKAQKTIAQLEDISPGLLKDLNTHFCKRIQMVEEYLNTLKKYEDPIIDNTEMELLHQNWNRIMHSAEEGVPSFCQEVTKYLNTFEEIQNIEYPQMHEEHKKSVLTFDFSNIDKNIIEHIAKIQQTIDTKLSN